MRYVQGFSKCPSHITHTGISRFDTDWNLLVPKDFRKKTSGLDITTLWLVVAKGAQSKRVNDFATFVQLLATQQAKGWKRCHPMASTKRSTALLQCLRNGTCGFVVEKLTVQNFCSLQASSICVDRTQWYQAIKQASTSPNSLLASRSQENRRRAIVALGDGKNSSKGSMSKQRV